MRHYYMMHNAILGMPQASQNDLKRQLLVMQGGNEWMEKSWAGR